MSVPRRDDTARLARAIDAAVRELAKSRSLTPQSVRRLEQLVRQFGFFASKGLGLFDLDGVRAEHVSAFLRARRVRGEIPSGATMHLRRSAVRLLFATAREIGLATTDPTLDLTLPPRSSLHRRAMTDEEIALCRSFVGHTLIETRRPAAWALAETTARTSEIPHILRSNVDLAGGRVWIHGGSKTVPRWGQLSDWGAQRLEERLRSLNGDASVVYQGNGSAESRQASSCAAIAQTLQRAGLGGKPDLGPSSVAAWAGSRAFREGAPIEEVARMLGIRSLDRAARFIGWDWTKER
jgi:site-specific recombinase XerC